MKNKETDVDCMKYRKSTHLAGVDVEMMVDEIGKCVLTIKEAYYANGVNVSGNKTDGYFLDFEENVKSMVANSGNRAKISKIVSIKRNLKPVEARNLKNWKGIQIELVFDPTIKMMGQVTGGISVKPTSPIPNISDEKAIKKLNESKTLPELQTKWSELSKQEQALPSVVKVKDELKLTLKAS